MGKSYNIPTRQTFLVFIFHLRAQNVRVRVAQIRSGTELQKEIDLGG